MKSFFKLLLAVLLTLFVGVGLYVGNLIYTELMTAPWATVLGVNDDSHDMTAITHLEQENGWEPVSITAPDGAHLAGTYIEAPEESHKTVIMLHGIYHNRGMSATYVPVYRKLGYNVLLIDQRGFGDSDGNGTTWGIHEIDDIDSWVMWVKSRDSQAVIGMHGVSLGAAMELLYAQTDEGKNIAFYVADSSYGDVLNMAISKLESIRADSQLIPLVKVISPFVQIATWYHTGHILNYYDPGEAVREMTSPVLFIHGSEDTLVSPDEAVALYENCRSLKKNLYICPGASHAMAYTTNPEAYENEVGRFLNAI